MPCSAAACTTTSTSRRSCKSSVLSLTSPRTTWCAAHQVVRGDVRDKTELLQDLRDVDVVVHAAALHGIHLERYTTDDFWNLNVVGTRNVYEAARESGIGKILLCSTMGVYGEGAR